MLKGSQFFLVFLFVTMLVGCTTKPVTVKDVTVRGYLQDRERVDQGVSGNSGYLQGTTKVDAANTKKTRKVYVVEVTKESVDPKDVKSVKINVDTSPKEESGKAQEVNQRISLPSSDSHAGQESTVMAVSAGAETEYVIEKDDTLQKIAKKFYGSYSKWTEIYEVNKEVLKDPNNIKPGLTIKIPSLQ